jgi:hypothetical protein
MLRLFQDCFANDGVSVSIVIVVHYQAPARARHGVKLTASSRPTWPGARSHAAATAIALLTTGTIAATTDNNNLNMPFQLTQPPIDRTLANPCLAQPHRPPDWPRERQGHSPGVLVTTINTLVAEEGGSRSLRLRHSL